MEFTLLEYIHIWINNPLHTDTIIVLINFPLLAEGSQNIYNTAYLQDLTFWAEEEQFEIWESMNVGVCVF
jgi:hypothetical protein